MLKELRGVRQIPGEGFRRWFRDEDFDLIVFYPEERPSVPAGPSPGGEEISGFQLCYRGTGAEGERVFSWYKTGGYAHNKIDDGETEPLRSKMTPVLTADGVFDSQTVLREFLCAASGIEPRIREEVRARIEGFAG
jgi:hypothetical protein